MTQWQWSVIMALVRYALYNTHVILVSDDQRDNDRRLLIEAYERDQHKWT